MSKVVRLFILLVGGGLGIACALYGVYHTYNDPFAPEFDFLLISIGLLFGSAGVSRVIGLICGHKE